MSEASNRRNSTGRRLRKLLASKANRTDQQQHVFNPEVDISERRAWSQRNRCLDVDNLQQRAMFEHFAIVGLPPNTNIRAVAADIKTYASAFRAGTVAPGLNITPDTPKENSRLQYGLKGPSIRGDILYSCPGNLSGDLGETLIDFCHPHGVRPELLERTPSMSSLNEIIYGQPHHRSIASSFVFTMKNTHGTTLYGVCCLVKELVHRPPCMAQKTYPECNAPLSRYMVVAPRCYCLLTQYPFFSLHFRVLSTILGLERLDRMAMYAGEVAGGVPSPTASLTASHRSLSSLPASFDEESTPGGTDEEVTSPTRYADGVTSRLSRLALSADVSAGYNLLTESPPTTPKDEVLQTPFFTPGQVAVVGGTRLSRMAISGHQDGSDSESDSYDTADSRGILYSGSLPRSNSQELSKSEDQSSITLDRCGEQGVNVNAVDILEMYLGSRPPSLGETLEFQPDTVLQKITYHRREFDVTSLGLRRDAAAPPDIEAAQNLGGWTVAVLCKCLSLENILTFLSGALLERQMVVFCPNVGLLSGIVLGLIPMLLPFSWQSLMLPVLPATSQYLELIEAPVPFVLGSVYKTPEVRARCGALIRVNVYKDKIKNAMGMPLLPSFQALFDALSGTHAALRQFGREMDSRPVYLISEAQQLLADCFLETLQKYLMSLVADVKGYTITDVSAEERIGVLLKDSFLESIPAKERPFMKQFLETQMFSVYCDAVL